MIHPARIHSLNNKPARATGGFVLYWMQQSQRAEWNHALEYAVGRANELNLPVAVVFGLMENYPEATEAHYAFMLQGLEETFQTLEKRGIGAFIGRGHPADVALEAGKEAALIVCDMGYLRHQVEWRMRVAEEADCEVVEVESDVVVPVETASDHAEYMARTIRPKILKQLDEFLQPLKPVPVANPWKNSEIRPRRFQGLEKTVPNVPRVGRFIGGTSEAKKRLRKFIAESLPVYEAHSNQPQTDDVSMLSPYLHFGQISPLYIALEIIEHSANLMPKKNCRAGTVADLPAMAGRSSTMPALQIMDSAGAFLEQLIVRRELAINFVWFTPDYDQFSCLPDWATQTLGNHAKDAREYLYTREQLEQSRTHDPYWNAAMTEMRVTGFMHNYMRMYWGKKVLEWSPSPEEAFETLLAMNNKYFLDGRDPNSYAGVAWVFGKHDTAWTERPVFGKTRYMNANGLKRKCDIEAYVAKVKRMG